MKRAELSSQPNKEKWSELQSGQRQTDHAPNTHDMIIGQRTSTESDFGH